MSKYIVKVCYMMTGEYVIEASSPEAAEDIALNESSGMPVDPKFVDGSMEIDGETEEKI
jgi:hypothetical protein